MQRTKNTKTPKADKLSKHPQNSITKKCGGCYEEFESSNSSHLVAFCPKCRKLRNTDVCEIITPEGVVICFQDISLAETMLKSMPATLRLDLHNTLDTLDPDVNVFADSCCISYVGRLTETRLMARADIQDRIKSGQIKYGALVFKRGNAKAEDGGCKFTEPGSKAWFNTVVPVDGDLKPLFIDDSEDHVKSVEFAGTRSIQINPGDSLIDLIEF